MATKTMAAVMVAAAAMLSIGCGGAAHIVHRGSYSGELALSGGEAARLSAIDPGAVAKADGAGTPDGERLQYVCVTLAEASR